MVNLERTIPAEAGKHGRKLRGVLYEEEIEQTLVRAPRDDDGARNGSRRLGGRRRQDGG